MVFNCAMKRARISCTTCFRLGRWGPATIGGVLLPERDPQGWAVKALREASNSFLAEIRAIVLESASGFAFAEFEREVLDIAGTLDPEVADCWSEALEEFRRGALAADGMEKLRRIRESDIPPVAVQLLTAPGVVHEIRTELTIPMTQSRVA